MFEDHVIVVVRNYDATKPYKTRWDGKFYTAPPLANGQPGQVAMPWVLAKRDFGDPSLVDTDPTNPYTGRARTNDLERLNARYGMLSASFYSGIPAVTAEIDGDRVDPQDYRVADNIAYTSHPLVGRFRHPNLPLVEVWTASATPERVFMLIDDPEGDEHRAKDRADSQVVITDDHDARLAFLEAELASLRAQQSIAQEIGAENAPVEVSNPMAPVAVPIATEPVTAPIASSDDIVTTTPGIVDLDDLNALDPSVAEAFAPDDTPAAAKPTPKKTPAR